MSITAPPRGIPNLSTFPPPSLMQEWGAGKEVGVQRRVREERRICENKCEEKWHSLPAQGRVIAFVQRTLCANMLFSHRYNFACHTRTQDISGAHLSLFRLECMVQRRDRCVLLSVHGALDGVRPDVPVADCADREPADDTGHVHADATVGRTGRVCAAGVRGGVRDAC